MTPHDGTVLGDRYRLDQRIAIGGMGEVWRAGDLVLGRDVAAKVLRGDLADRAGFFERFRREARNLAMLSHPAIAAVFDYGEQDGSPYLIMELVAGEDLARWSARRGAMPPDDVIALLTQISAGLAAAHAAGLVHRDIKPANLMITDRGAVKITDFGISRHTESVALTATHEVLGTPQYMAPEQLTGHPASPAGDVYSLGIVAYELLAGRAPFVADSNIALAMAQVNDLPPPLPSTVPPGLEHLVGRMLAKDPDRRPPDGAALLHEIERLTRPDPRDGPGPPVAAAQLPATEVLFAPTIARPPVTDVADVADVAATVAMSGVGLAAASAASSAPRAARSSSLIGPLRRHRTKRWISVGLAVAVIVALVWAIASAGRSDGTDGVTEPTGSGTADAVASSTTAAPTETAPATAAPSTIATVFVDPAAYLGRDRREVIDELRALGFTVEERRVDTDDVEKNTVVAVDPSGPVPPDSVIEVTVARPGKGDDDDD